MAVGLGTSGKAGKAEVSKKKRTIRILLGLVLLALLLAGLWRFSPLGEMATPEALQELARSLRGSFWTPPIVIGVYLAASAVMFPNTVLNLATILGLGGIYGFICAFGASLTAALVFCLIGRRFGASRLAKIDMASVDKLTKMFRQGGTLSVFAVRMLPLAPFPVVNLVAGAARVKLIPFFIGTCLGLLPGTVTVALFGAQLRQVLKNPGPGSIAILVLLTLAGITTLWLLKRKFGNRVKQ